MSDWLQRYQATKEKKFKELGEFLATFPSGGQKGGPGSGHWGHAGRPGKRGGSVPGSVAVSIRTGRTAAERQREAAAGGGKPVLRGEEPDIPYSELTEEERRAWSELSYARQWQVEALASVITPLREQIGRNSPRHWRNSARSAERQAEDWERLHSRDKRMLRLAKDKRKDAERYRRWADDLARQWQDRDNPQTIKAREAMRRASRQLRELERMYAEAKKLPRHIDARRLVQRSAQKGGPGSGHWGHAGRPGLVGGSAAGRMAGRGLAGMPDILRLGSRWGRVSRNALSKPPSRGVSLLSRRGWSAATAPPRGD